jgi:exopolyphosphatase/guanosine-5'-triphosphate,3'-diphosphate pyrophosphatase
LHDIGYWISHDQHHKHSYYIITHSDLPGFTNDEADIIGTIARYHRKSHPKSKHSEYSSFNQRTKYIINVLAGILRIAEGVDRRQKQNVKDISVNFPDNQEEMNILQIDKKPIIELNLIPIKTKKAIDIEIWGAKRRTELLEEILEINIDVK